MSSLLYSVYGICICRHLYCCSICGKYVSSLLLFYLLQIRVISTAVLPVANTCHLYCCSICGKQALRNMLHLCQAKLQSIFIINFLFPFSAWFLLCVFCCCFFLLLFSLFPHSKASFQKVMHPAHQTISIFAFYICAIKFQVVHKPV